MMCLATVYIEDDGQREEVMQDVAWIKPANGGLQLITFLGESKLFQARIESIDLMNSLIVLKRMTIDSPERVPGDQEGKLA
jgi:predicted RNA-binding protein